MGEGNVAVAMSLPAGRGPPPLPRPGLVRPRCLFGRPDPLYLKDALSQISQENKLRWNFDFERERPLSGRYKWEAVGPPKSPGPAAPTDCGAASRDPAIAAGPASSSGGAAAAGDDRCSEKKSSAESGDAAAASRQTRITDYMRKRKSSISIRGKQTASAPPPKRKRRAST